MFHRRDGALRLIGRDISCRSDVATRAFALNATPIREYGDSTDRNRRVYNVNALESLTFLRSFPRVTVQARGSSTAPEKTREERAAGVETGSSSESPGSDEKPSKAQQLKKVFKEYGAVGVSFHIGISLMSLGIIYLAVSSGLDMTSVLYKVGFSESVVQSRMAAGTSTFVLAYAVHKLFAPLRISITLVSVPLIVRHLRRTGLFKPKTSGPHN